MNVRTLFLVLITLLALLTTEVVRATCGGGGGGGKGGMSDPYRTTWEPSWDGALKTAEAGSIGVVLYFPPEDEPEEHRFFQTKIPNDASEERGFYKVGEEEKVAKVLRKEFKPKSSLHVVYICDWFGNPFKAVAVRARTKINGRKVRDTLYGIPKLAARLIKKLNKEVDKAENAVDRENWTTAIKATAAVLPYKGYEAVAKATRLREKINEAGQAQLKAALETPDAGQRKTKLGKVKRTFKGTSVEKLAAEALKKKTARVETERPAVPALAAATWNELFGEIDWASLPPTMAERVESTLRAGIAAEKAGRYDDALVKYATAAGLDVGDPIPLVYLGELHRHHLGNWDEAMKVFERVVAMDRDDFATAVALHGIGKMTIWGGDNDAGLALFAKSIGRHPTALCYRNLAVYWNTEGDAKRAFAYATKAYELDPKDSYSQVFYSVYLLMNGREEQALRLMAAAEFDPSMSYNYACYHAVRGEREKVLYYLRKHFHEYEQTDAVRSFEMAEARMDGFFKPWFKDPEFREVTALAGRTPWLDE